VTLVEFLRARLNEDEQKARRAAELCGCHPPAPSWKVHDEETDGRIVVVDDPHPEVKRKLWRRWSNTYEGLFAAEHIVRHDPARVLREVEAKRELVLMYEAILDTGGFVGTLYANAAEPALRLLALPYAAHEDFREEWRPQRADLHQARQGVRM
jgi:uncharacterized protein DUF6221